MYNPLVALLTIYSYFTGMLREFNVTKGSRVRFGQLAKTDEGIQGEVKFLDISEE